MEWAEGIFAGDVMHSKGVGAWYGAEQEIIGSEHSTAKQSRARMSAPSTQAGELPTSATILRI